MKVEYRVFFVWNVADKYAGKNIIFKVLNPIQTKGPT